jgi:hypothetical protein
MTRLSRPIRILIILGLALASSACQPSGTVSPVPLSILPKDCRLTVSQQIGVSINGVITSQAQVAWSAQRGLIVKNPEDFGALYTAPTEEGLDQITVSVAPSHSGGAETLILNCEITDDAQDPPTESPTQPTDPTLPTIAISEVMSHVCGGDEYRIWNQYVELYNYGSQPVDVGGWFLSDEGQPGSPDQLVSWGSRFTPFDFGLVNDTTLIPPGGFAIILTPQYPQAPNPHRMPYRILPGTIILTVSDDSLGDDYLRILGNEPGYDTLTLYLGSPSVIHMVVDTYGTPSIPSPYPSEIDDDRLDAFPYYLSACTSIERINPAKPDSQSNWRIVPGGSPGDGLYR